MLWDWVIGLLVVSLIGGQFCTAILLVLLRKNIEKKEGEFKEFTRKEMICSFSGIRSYPPDPKEHVPPWIIGPAERLFFTLVVAAEVSGAAVAMAVWMTLKMATGRPYRKGCTESQGALLGFPWELTGLLGNLSSMFFALIGGLIIKERMWTQFVCPIFR